MAASREQRPSLSAVAVLPARLASTRLPRKVLLAETGTPLFVHTARNVDRCPAIGRVVVATDAEEVLEVGRQSEIEVVMTSIAHNSGTDRVHEAVQGLGQAYDVIVNVQADEPDVDPGSLAQLISLFDDPDVRMATLAVPLESSVAVTPASVVKVALDRAGRALYFSRANIPDRSHARGAASTPGLRHVGVYAFRPDALEQFCSMQPGSLEETENLEQLRWLEAGESIQVQVVEYAPLGIDTEADYQSFVARQAVS